MVKNYTSKDLDQYLKNDFILEKLREYPQDNIFKSQKWLLDIPAKRMIYADVYGDLLKTKGKKILDIAGGFCGLTRELVKNHNYTLVDVMTYGENSELINVEKEIGKFWFNSDWSDFNFDDDYDVIIANDIFPNVDQRLEKFIKKAEGKSNETVITLTCYDQSSKFAEIFEKIVLSIYNRIKRVNGDMMFFTKCPNTIETNIILEKSLGKNPPVLDNKDTSLFTNKRSVSKIIY